MWAQVGSKHPARDPKHFLCCMLRYFSLHLISSIADLLVLHFDGYGSISMFEILHRQQLCKACKACGDAGRLLVQASGNVSQLEAQVAGLQQSLLQAKDLVHVKLQDAVLARKQADKQIKASYTHTNMPHYSMRRSALKQSWPVHLCPLHALIPILVQRYTCHTRM